MSSDKLHLQEQKLNHKFFSIITYSLDLDVGPNPAYETRSAEPRTLFFQYS